MEVSRDLLVDINKLGDHVGAVVTLQGWVETTRGHGKVAFVVARDGVACVGVAIESDAASSGRVVHLDLAGAGAEFIPWILSVDAAFDGVAVELDVALREFQRLAH